MSPYMKNALRILYPVSYPPFNLLHRVVLTPRSEARAREFKERNLLSTNSPESHLPQARYQRDVHINEEIILTIRREFEVTKLAEQKDMPALDALDAPEKPMFKSGPQRRKSLAFLTFLDLLSGCLLIVGLENRRAIADHLRDIAGKAA